jgi:hypothetical protein
MAETTWNTSAPAKPRRRSFPVWLAVPLVLILAGAVIGIALAGRATGLRRQAWPLIQAVHQRLATDDGARDIYRKNPLCAEGYPSEEEFVEAARTWRAKIGTLPAAEPAESPHDYDVSSDPFELTVACRGAAGGWLRARFSTGPATGGREAGEGLSQLVFSDSRKGLQDSARTSRRQARSQQWAEFRALLLRLGADDTALALYRAEPALRERWRTEQAFLDETRGWRPALTAIPEALPDAEANPALRAEFRRSHSPFGQRRAILLHHGGGVWKVTWRDGALADLAHGTAASARPGAD